MMCARFLYPIMLALVLIAPLPVVADEWEASAFTPDANPFMFHSASPAMPYRAGNRDEPLHVKRDGLDIFVSHHFSPRTEDYVIPVLEIFETGKPAISAAFSDSETMAGRVWLAVEHLDPGSAWPQVLLTRYDGGGARCCLQTTIFTAMGGSWERIDAPFQYAGVHYRLKDIDGDGVPELLGLDSDFVAANRYSGPVDAIPVRAYALRGAQLLDVSNLLDDPGMNGD